jgi:ABC-type Mn2+/Zn2+ transport system permease subunit
VLAGAVAIALAGRDERLGGDVGVAVAVSALLGLGGMLALSPAVPPRLGELLFGDLLGVSGSDLAGAGALVAVTAAALALGHRPLALATFDPPSAPSLGARPGRWELVLLVLLALATVAAVRGLGNLLAVAIVLAPGATALNLTRRLGHALAAAAGLAALAGAGGLLLSYHAGLAAGASVALCAVALFAASLAVTPRAAGG